MKTVVDLVSSLKTYFTGKDTAAKQAVEQIIAPVETDATSSSGAYSVGDQLTLNDVLYDVIAPISSSDALTVGTNIKAASDISTQIKNVKTDISEKQDQMQFSTMPTASATYAGKVVIYTGATTATYTSGQSYQCVESSGSYSWEPTAAGSIAASNVTYNGTTSGSSETDAQGAIDDLYSQNQTLESALNGKINTSDIANNLTTTIAGKVLDARQGKTLNDSISALNDITSLTGTSFSSSYGTFDEGFTTLEYNSIIAELNIRFTATSEISAWTSIFSLPNSIKPKRAVSLPLYTNAQFIGTMRISTSGAVSFENNVASGVTFEGRCLFFR